MTQSKRVLVVADYDFKPGSQFLSLSRKLGKGLVRLGHDVETFSFGNALIQRSPLKSKDFARRFFKSRVDKLVREYTRSYAPHIIVINFPKNLDGTTALYLREAAPDAVMVGIDGDPWPHCRPNQLAVAPHLDHVVATNDGRFLNTYRDAGTSRCHFLPNCCDPDYEHPYSVSEKWQSDVLWTGKIGHHADVNDPIREAVINRLVGQPGVAIYGCLNRPNVKGIDYYYAISGAKIGVHINVVNDVSRYHSDRIIHYLSTGTFVLAKRVPDTESLFVDGRHLRYFDTVEEFESLLEWYRKHDEERRRIAEAGMNWSHEVFNCRRMASHLLEVIDHGSYSAPWTG